MPKPMLMILTRVGVEAAPITTACYTVRRGGNNGLRFVVLPLANRPKLCWMNPRATLILARRTRCLKL
jgi:hypothetical protein